MLTLLALFVRLRLGPALRSSVLSLKILSKREKAGVRMLTDDMSSSDGEATALMHSYTSSENSCGFVAAFLPSPSPRSLSTPTPEPERFHHDEESKFDELHDEDDEIMRDQHHGTGMTEDGGEDHPHHAQVSTTPTSFAHR
jgi:hypothetical protein